MQLWCSHVRSLPPFHTAGRHFTWDDDHDDHNDHEDDHDDGDSSDHGDDYHGNYGDCIGHNGNDYHEDDHYGVQSPFHTAGRHFANDVDHGPVMSSNALQKPISIFDRKVPQFCKNVVIMNTKVQFLR